MGDGFTALYSFYWRSNWGKVRREVPKETGVRPVLRRTVNDCRVRLRTSRALNCNKQVSGFFLLSLTNVPKIYEHSVTERLLFCNAANTDLKRHQRSPWEFRPFAVET